MKHAKAVCQDTERVERGASEGRERQVEFVRRGMAAIQDAQRNGTGIPAEQMMARLDAKLTAARQGVSRRS